MSKHDRTVKVPFEFFRKVRRDYNDWRMALIRELIQNSADAGATRIDFLTTWGDDGLTLTCSDNGKGMSRETLLDVFMVLGGTEKEAGSVGGFGMAKMVIFSADSYYVTTRGLRVDGSGGEFRLSNDGGFGPGVSVGLKLGADYGVSGWQTTICEYVSRCNLASRNVTVTLNGIAIESKGFQGDFEFGTGEFNAVYSAASQDYTRVDYVMRGLLMFSKHYFGKGARHIRAEVTLEGSSLELFTTNRDAFKGDHATAAETFVANMVNRYRSVNFGSTHVSVLNYTTPYNIDGYDDGAPVAIVNESLPANFVVYGEGIQKRRNARVSTHMTPSEIAKAISKSNTSQIGRQWVAVCQLILNSPFCRKHGVTSYTAPNEIGVNECIDLNEYYLQGERITMGFAFVQGAEALCRGGVKQLLVNPLVLPADLLIMDLYDLALHEITHLWQMNHGEEFTLFDGEMRRALRREFDEKTIVKFLKDC